MSQVIKKFIGNNQVGAAKIQLENNAALRGRNAANSADVNILKINTSDQIETQGSLIPSVDNSQTLGSTSKRFATAYAESIKDASDNLVLLASSRWLLNTAGNLTVNFDSGELKDPSTGTTKIAWVTGLISDSAGVASIDFQSRVLSDGAGQNALNYNSRVISNSSGATTIDFATIPTIHTSDGGVSGARLQMNDEADVNNITLQVPTGLVASYTLTLPPDDGSSGQVLQTNGSGVTSWVSVSSGATNNKELKTLSGTDITNQYVDLAHVALTNSISFLVKGGGVQIEGASFDYSVSYTGGSGGHTRITFLNDLATGGLSALIAGDVVVAQYQY